MLRYLVLALISIPMAADSATAAMITLDQTDRGSYSAAGAHSSSNLNYITGYVSGIEFRSFFVFDLSGISDPIDSAMLRIPTTRRVDGADASETLEIHDVSTSMAALTGGTGGAGAFADLGTGALFGSAVSLRVNDGLPLDVTLNASGVLALDSATGLFAFGGALSTLNHPGASEFIFGTSADLPPNVQLLITTSDASSEVPEPASAALMILGGAAFMSGRVRQRTRRNRTQVA